MQWSQRQWRVFGEAAARELTLLEAGTRVERCSHSAVVQQHVGLGVGAEAIA